MKETGTTRTQHKPECQGSSKLYLTNVLPIAPIPRIRYRQICAPLILIEVRASGSRAIISHLECICVASKLIRSKNTAPLRLRGLLFLRILMGEGGKPAQCSEHLAKTNLE
jgi:hypothetical protein